MKQNVFNELYEKYEKCTDNDDFNNISFFGFTDMTEKQKNKFGTLMITKGCKIRRNHRNEFYVYNNQGVGIQVSNETLLQIVKGCNEYEGRANSYKERQLLYSEKNERRALLHGVTFRTRPRDSMAQNAIKEN